MLFSSYTYVLLFLPLVASGYFFANAVFGVVAARVWLVLSSFFFYGWWDVVYVPLLLGSIGFNYGLGSYLSVRKIREKWRPQILLLGVVANLSLLGYFKYADFFLQNVGLVFGAEFDLLQLALPIGISFFTFQQIAFLFDAGREDRRAYTPVNYALFVCFFPQLIAGPIVHHREMMPQFEDARNDRVRLNNISAGLFIFAIGLFKKVVLADTFGEWADAGYRDLEVLTFLQAWMTSLSYTFQLYFDFSGYADMAVGAGLLFNIRLPINFYSPYKSRNIQEFWRRWHMTLGRFLREYLYIPLGGSQKGEGRLFVNLAIVFLLGGLWHGASWMFVAWGALHGSALIVHQLWCKAGVLMPRFLAWLLTFLFVNIAWVFFRAETLPDAVKVLRGMAGLDGIVLPVMPGALATLVPQLDHLPGVSFGEAWREGVTATPYLTIILILASVAVVALARNSIQLLAEYRPNFSHTLVVVVLLGVSLMMMGRTETFIYWPF